MFVVMIDYIAEIEAIDAQLAAHREWLAAGVAEGRLLAAGRKVPRTGGALFVKGESKAEVEAWVAADPFALAGVARYEVTELAITVAAPGLESLLP